MLCRAIRSTHERLIFFSSNDQLSSEPIHLKVKGATKHDRFSFIYESIPSHAFVIIIIFYIRSDTEPSFCLILSMLFCSTTHLQFDDDATRIEYILKKTLINILPSL